MNSHFKCIHITLDMVLLEAAVAFLPETLRLQLFHLHLRVRQRCQFVLINLLLGSSLVSNVEAAAAPSAWLQGGGDTPSLDLASLFQKGTSALYLCPIKHRHTWTAALQTLNQMFKHIFDMSVFPPAEQNKKNKIKGKCSSRMSHGKSLDVMLVLGMRWDSRGNPYLLDSGHMWLYIMFDLPRACKQNVDLKSLHSTKVTDSPTTCLTYWGHVNKMSMCLKSLHSTVVTVNLFVCQRSFQRVCHQGDWSGSADILFASSQTLKA